MVSIKNILLLALPAVAIAGGVYGYYYNASQKIEDGNYLADIANAQKKYGPPTKLDAAYTDKDGDLVADAPAKTVNPDTLVFSGLGQNEPDKGKANWQSLIDALAKATGKKVEYLAYPEDPENPGKQVASPEKQLEAMKKGLLHVTVFNTGLVPTAVNNAGFVPLALPAKADGSFAYQMEILVPADSDIKDAAGLKGKQLTLSNASSNAGFKAPIFLLHSLHGLAFGKDYSFNISGTYDRSLEGLAAKKYQAAAVPNDYLERFFAKNEGKYSRGQFKSVMKSEDFPPLCLGVAHDLDPALAGKIKDAVFNFAWAGTSVEKEFGAAGQSKFVPANYKANWALVRTIDEGLANLAGRGK